MSRAYELVMLLGAVQGFVLSVAVLGRRRARALVANWILALFLVLVSLRLGIVLLSATRGWRGSDWSLPLPFTFPPLLWIYLRALTEPGFRLGAPIALHALPAALVALLAAVDGLPSTPRPPDPLDVAWTAQALAYVAAILARIRSHRRRVEEVGSSDRARLDWVRSLTLTFAVTLGLMLVYLGSFLVGRPMPAGSSRILYAGVAVVVCAWGYLGLRDSAVLQPAPASVPPPPPGEPTEVPDAEAADLLDRLARHMTDAKPYLDPDLTLRGLASQLGVSPYALSRLINRGLGQNFFRFVNGHRVAEAKRLLAAAGGDKVLAVALDSGFSAKSSFNRVFREIAGVTPSEYRRSLSGAGGSLRREGGSTS